MITFNRLNIINLSKNNVAFLNILKFLLIFENVMFYSIISTNKIQDQKENQALVG